MPKKLAWPVVAALALLAGIKPQGGVPGEWRAIGAIQPRITADGRGIAFSYQGALWVIALAGGEAGRLTRDPGFDEHPAWSPDGKRIAYVRGGELRIMDPETAAPVPLAAKVNAAGKLLFSPDGRRLLGNFGASLSWLDLEGGGVRPVLDPPRRVPVFALSPNGSRIAYVTSQDVDGEQGGVNGPQADVWGVPAEGGAPKRLLRFRSRIFDLWWSGGDLIAASDLGGAHNDLWTISLDDPTHAHRITNGQGDEDSPSVSADGRWLVYTDNRESATALVVRDLKSGEDRTLPITRLDFGSPTGRLLVELVEKGKGAPLTARVSIQQKAGKHFAPPGALYRMLGNVEHFYAAKAAVVPVPAGTYTLRAFRGTEYREARQEVAVGPGETVTVRLELERWTDPPARGWWGGESHIHANYGYGQWYNTPATMRLQVEGEGLNLANMVVANSDTDGIFDREYFRGEPDPVSTKDHVLYWNEEFRSTLWGHMTLYNLRHLVEPIMTGFRATTNPWDVPTNADIADHTHLQGGHVNYTHPAQNPRDPFLTAYSAKAMPVDVALGKIDSLDVNAGYEATVPLWYRLLNCGFRLPASAGTDVFLNRIRSRLPGSDRAYVKLDGPFSYGAWVQGLKAGRSFVTNGPMLEFSAAGKSLGETVTLAAPGPVAIRAKAEAAVPLLKVEVVHNGTVVATDVSSIDQAVRIEKSGWIGFRAYAGGTQAHSSPIYIEVAGKPAASKEDAEYFLKWIDRLEAKLKERDRLPSEALRAHVDGQLNAARAVYAKVIARAE